MPSRKKTSKEINYSEIDKQITLVEVPIDKSARITNKETYQAIENLLHSKMSLFEIRLLLTVCEDELQRLLLREKIEEYYERR